MVTASPPAGGGGCRKAHAPTLASRATTTNQATASAAGLSSRRFKARRSQPKGRARLPRTRPAGRSEEHTSELQSLMRISYAVFCLKKKNNQSHERVREPA